MKSHHHALLAMIFCTSLIAGCASSGTTATNSAVASTAESNASTQNSHPEKKKPDSPGAEPECE